MSEAVTIIDPATGTQAKIATELGFNCFDFTASINNETVALLDAPEDFLEGDAKPTRYGIPILFPFPNRIRLGKFQWNGKEYELPLNGPHGNAIHGFCLDRPWRITEQTQSSVTGEFQLSVDAADRINLWPADFILRVTYEVIGNRLHSQIDVENPDSQPLPWGFGTHAYFKLPFGKNSSASQCIVKAPASQEWVLKDFLPTGEIIPVPEPANLQSGKPFGELSLDNVLTGLPKDEEILECILTDEQAGISMKQTCPLDVFRELVAFTPAERDAVCLEPYTCVTDAINLDAQGVDAGWQVLNPGEKISTWIDLTVESI